jgi:hypothetical protein
LGWLVSEASNSFASGGVGRESCDAPTEMEPESERMNFAKQTGVLQSAKPMPCS